MAKEQKDIIAGVDIGTEKVMVAIAELTPEQNLQLLGLGISKNEHVERSLEKGKAVEKGVIVNIDTAVLSIQKALHQAQEVAGCKIKRVCVGVSGSHIQSHQSDGAVPVNSDKEVTSEDIERLMDVAKAIHIPSDRQLFFMEPREYLTEGRISKTPPIGQSGVVRIEAQSLIVTGSRNAAENISKCLSRCDLELERLMINGQASSRAVLTADERELGVAVLDIGAGATDVTIIIDGTIRHIEVWPFAGDAITLDIAKGLSTPIKDAEELKIRHGCAKGLLTHPQEQICIPGLGGGSQKTTNRQTLATVIEARMKEILIKVRDVVIPQEYDGLLSAGIVITGGSSVLPGLAELAADIFPCPVRCVMPKYPSTLAEMTSMAQPNAATLMGLLEEERLARMYVKNQPRHTNDFKKQWKQFVEFIKTHF